MFGRIGIGQYMPVESVIHALDPRIKMLMVAVFMLAAFCAKDPPQFGLLILTGTLILSLSRIRITHYLAGLKPFWMIIIVTVIFLIVLTRGNTILDLRLIRITDQGIIAGASLMVRLVLILVIAQVLTITTTPSMLSTGLGRLLKPLARVGFPVQETIMIMGLALRFIPLLTEEGDRIAKAQMCRGAGLNNSGMVMKIRNLLALMVPLLAGGFKRASDLARAMEARCYTGGERSSLYDLRLRGNDYLFLMMMVVWVVLFVLSR